MSRINQTAPARFILLVLLGAFLLPQISHALTYDFNGTVLYDNQAANSFRPGLGDSFSGSLALADNGSLTFYNNTRGTQYSEPGPVTTGQFTHNNIEYLYAYSQGATGTPQMGLLWWSEPRPINVQGTNYYEISGLAFYLEGYNYTPALLIAQSINEYITKGNLSGLFRNSFNLHYSGCQVKYGSAFLGLLTEPFVPQPAPSAVPLPASVWLLASGLVLLWRRK